MKPMGKPVVVIAGGGISGLALALALRQGLGAGLDVVLVDPDANPRQRDTRAYALSAGSVHLFSALGLWESIAPRAQPILHMDISDSRTADVVRPAFLSFAAPEESSETLGHMVESQPMLAVLRQAAVQAGITLRRAAIRRAVPDGATVRVGFDHGPDQQAHLLVDASGARSPLREMAGIGWVGWRYGQSGIVATIAHERDHEGRAVEHFLPAGPFAILPLVPENGVFRSSIVWTEATRDALALLELDKADLMSELERRFGLQLGQLQLLSPAQSWPLSFGMARRFAAERLALVGDAAHVIHPLAGQGLNLGLKDVAALAQIIVEAARLGLDIGSTAVLGDYERQRRPDAVLMAGAMDGLNRLFSNDSTPVRLLRDLGLGVVDRLPPLKRFFMRQASGNSPTRHLPRLLRGEAL